MFAVDVRRVLGRLRVLLAVVAAVGGLVACGHQLTLRGHALGISELEYRLRPDHIVAPGTLTVSVHNYGRLTHNVVITRPRAVPVRRRTRHGIVTGVTTIAARTPDLPPGQGTTLIVRLAPGRYGLASTLQDDQGQGMQGTLTVTSK